MNHRRYAFLPAQHVWSECRSNDALGRATGFAFHQGRLYRAPELAALLCREAASDQGFAGLLDSLNGHFALVLEEPGSIRFATDAIRSFPLYFREDGDELPVSDSYARLRRDSDPLDMDAVAELATAGFVTGNRTLHGGVRALQCAEWARGDATGLRLQRYELYWCTYDADDEEALCAGLEQATLHSFERALEFCGGRQVALPLSGGLDSRLVAVMLKRLKYDNVLCFTYGLPGNYELSKSRAAAETLGFPWVFLPYGPENLRHALFSEEAHRYKVQAHGGVSLPFIDDWPALHDLKRKGLVAPDAVFMPGQSGDFTCGSHLKYLLGPEWNADPMDVEGAIVRKHFSNWEDILARQEVREGILRRMREQEALFAPLERQEDCAAFYEFWECQERQVKYVINGGRGYEFFGHQWVYPLWDRELMAFWRPVSLGLKMDSYLYRKYLAEHDPYGLFKADRRAERWTREWALERLAGKKARTGGGLWDALAAWPLVGGLVRFQRLRRKHRHFLRRNPLGYPRGFGMFRYTWRELGKRHHLSLVLKDFLKREYGLDIHRALLG